MNQIEFLKSKQMTAEEAAELIQHNEVVGTSGFTPAGYPKAIPKALANKARRLHDEGHPFSLTLFTGASTGDELDGELSRANAIHKRLPYQSHPDLRKSINSGKVEFLDMHLSQVAQYLSYGFLPKPETAIVEAVDVMPDGRIYLTTSVGLSPTFLKMANRILIEINRSCPHDLIGFHDIYLPDPPPKRHPIPIQNPGTRIGTEYVKVDPEKIIGIVETNEPDKAPAFKHPDENSLTIARIIVDFLLHERKMGRLPQGLPFQSGVGNVANAVLSIMAQDPQMGPISMYTEVLQDCIFDLLEADKLEMASATSLTLSPEGRNKFLKEIRNIRGKIILRPQEISNNPELIRRLGTVSMNTALEIDIFGNVNSTHVLGSRMMNGIGGSGDFCRNAYLPIFMLPSVQKGGKISGVVPMVTHVDHSEHSTQIIVTEQGLADLRGLTPVQKAHAIINNCAHPEYREMLRDYLEYGLKNAPSHHTPQVLKRAFEMHERFAESGSMMLQNQVNQTIKQV